MKNKLKLTALSLLLSITGYTQYKQFTTSEINAVTVFLNKAQISRNASISIDKGNTEIILTGLSAQIEPNSIQVSGIGALTILGIRHERNYLSDQDESQEIRILRDSLRYYKSAINEVEVGKEIYKKEEIMLASNQVISGKDRGVTVSELKSMADFYTSRLTQIAKSRTIANIEIEKYIKRQKAVQRQLNELNAYYQKNTSSIIVEVTASKTTPVKLDVQYVVHNASWQPIYDIRSTGTDQPIELNYKANIRQNTGVSWKNVSLTLSTANPNLSNLKPTILPWHLDFQQDYMRALKGKSQGVLVESVLMTKENDEFADFEDEELKEVGTISDFTQTVNTALNMEFEISIPYTVASGGKPTTVDIRKEKLNAEYSYVVVPKLDSDAFLVASVPNWEQYELLAGTINLFFEGTYVGKTYINPSQVKDHLELSLGRAKHIVVERKPIKDFTSEKLLGSNIKKSFAYEIAIRNTNKHMVKLRVEDHIPISSHKDIVVDVLDLGGGVFDKLTGQISWELTVSPESGQQKKYSYEVKFPKEKPVSGL